MKVSPIQKYIYDTPPDSTKEKLNAFVAEPNNPYYEGLSDEERKQILLTRYHEGELVDRIYIQKYLLRDFPDYIENETKETQRRFLGRQFNCNCSDCDGMDTTADCLVESAFYEKSGLETPMELIRQYSVDKLSQTSPLSLSMHSTDSSPDGSIDYEEQDELESSSLHSLHSLPSIQFKSRVSLTYEDIKKVLETEVNL